MPFAMLEDAPLLNRLFRNASTVSFETALGYFHQAYDNLQTGYALCEGLEVVAANAAFENIFDIACTRNNPVFLNRLLADQGGVERLFSYISVPVEFTTPKQLAISVQPWAVNGNFWLLSVEDRSELEGLRRKLVHANNHDPSTGALRRGAFNARLDRLLRRMGAANETGLIAQISFSAPDNRLSGLNSEEKDSLLANLVAQLHWELGTECLLCRQDTLALTAFTPFEGSASESNNLLRQMGRLAAQISRKHQTILAVRIGAATFPNDGQSLASLLSAADRARDEIDQSPGRNDFAVQHISPTIIENHTRLRRLARDMPAAIGNGSIAPHFQPVIQPASGNILGFETLIRWHHPELGNVPPPQLIEIAKELGLLDALTGRTMRAAAEQAKDWPDHVHFAVNVTPSQLNSALVDRVRQTVRNTSIEPSRLEIEVTEDALIEDFKSSASIFARLRAIGVSIAMDDFGSGYTSVGNLQSLDFDKIKIDKSISDRIPHDRRSVAIVRSLLYMARELDIRITVEGIEKEEQLEFLRAFNCGVQGYIYSPPVPPSQLHQMKRFLKTGDGPETGSKILGIGPRKHTRSEASKASR